MSNLTDAFQSADNTRLAALLDEHVVLNSPIRESGFTGRQAVLHILSQAREFIDGFHCALELRQDQTAMIRVLGTVNGKEVDAIYHLRLTPSDTIQQMWVYLRPLPGLQAFANEMGKRLGMITS